MVAKTAPLPNVRKLFVPDPGMIIADADLAGADAQVVAWEADDRSLMDAFRSGIKIHVHNAREMFPDKTKGMSDEALKATDHSGGIYFCMKRGVHATNYGGTPPTLAAKLGWTVHESEQFQRRWFEIHPGIRDWQQRMFDTITMSGQQFFDTYGLPGGDKTVYNRFGYRRIFFERSKDCMGEVLAWVPQSTVALVTNRGALQVHCNLPWVQLLLQVHDSLVFQYPRSAHARRDEIRTHLENPVPYPEPLTIPWGLATSVKSWGDCEETKWAA